MNKTGLHYAAERNGSDMFSILLSRGADINEKDNTFLNIILFILNMIISK